MGKKRNPGAARKGGAGSWIWKSVVIGTTVGIGLCAVAAVLVMQGMIPQGGAMTAGRICAALGVLTAGAVCAWLAKERRLLWCGVCCGGMTVCAFLLNLAMVGRIGGAGYWLAGAALALLMAAGGRFGGKKRARRRK